MIGKKRNLQHRIGDKAMKLVKSSLPDNDQIGIVLTEIPQQEDYGVDGFVQIFEGELRSGDTFLVQVKGTNNVTLDKTGAIQFDMKLIDLQNYIEILNDPMVLLFVDVKEEQVYWHDIQLNLDTLDRYKKAQNKFIGTKAYGTKKVRIHINPQNKLPDSFSEMLEVVKDSKARLNKRAEVLRLSQSDFSHAMHELKDYLGSALYLKGFDWVIRSSTSIITRGNPIFSTSTSEGLILDFYPNSQYTEEQVPRISMKFKVPTKEKEAIQILKNAKNDPFSLAKLAPKYLDEFKFETGGKIVTESSTNKGSMMPSLHIEPTKTYRDIFLKNLATDQEIILKAVQWVDKDNNLILETDNEIKQPLELKLKLNFKTKSSKINFKINEKLVNNITDAAEYLNFTSDWSKGLELFFIYKGVKKRLLEFEGINKSINQGSLKLINMLAAIEKYTGISIEYPLPNISKKEFDAIKLAHDLISKNESKARVDFVIDRKYKDKIKNEGVFRLEGMEIQIFNQILNFPGKVVKVEGKVDNIAEAENGIKLTSEKARISLSDNNKEDQNV